MDNNEPENISEELLSLLGIYQILKKCPVGIEILISFDDGQKLLGIKKSFDENLGILCLSTYMPIPTGITSTNGMPELKKKKVDLFIRLSKITSVGFFPSNQTKVKLN